MQGWSVHHIHIDTISHLRHIHINNASHHFHFFQCHGKNNFVLTYQFFVLIKITCYHIDFFAMESHISVTYKSWYIKFDTNSSIDKLVIVIIFIVSLIEIDGRNLAS
jgi:hypothetical protein